MSQLSWAQTSVKEMIKITGVDDDNVNDDDDTTNINIHSISNFLFHSNNYQYNVLNKKTVDAFCYNATYIGLYANIWPQFCENLR